MTGRRSLVLLLFFALAAGPWGCGNPTTAPAGQGPGAQALADPARPPAADRGPGSAGEDVYTVLLPIDPGLIPPSGYTDALVATLKFRKEGESLNVGLKVMEGRIHVSSVHGTRTAFEEGGFVKKEEIVEGPGPGEPRRPVVEVEPPLFDAVTGKGSAGVDPACARLAKEIRERGGEALLHIDAGPDVPAGLVLEGYRRGAAEPGVVSVDFLGAVNPLEGGARPARTIWSEAAEIAIHTDEALLRDAADGSPVLRVSEASGKIKVGLPFARDPPKVESGGEEEEEEEEATGLSQVSALMKEFAARTRDPKDPRLSSGWLEVRVPAETPYAVVQAVMQAACSAGVGIRKIRIVLPANHAFKVRIR